MSDTQDLMWLVDRRSRSQSFLLQLYTFAEKHSANITEPQSAVFQLLVGTAFSLWRAAFLTESDRPEAQIGQHTKQFLLLLVRDNSINYTQDRQTRAWTVGYYLNNAYFRLHLAYQNLSMDSDGGVASGTASRKAIDTFLQEQARVEGPLANSRDLWDKAHEAALEIFEVLLQTVQSSENA